MFIPKATAVRITSGLFALLLLGLSPAWALDVPFGAKQVVTTSPSTPRSATAADVDGG